MRKRLLALVIPLCGLLTACPGSSGNGPGGTGPEPPPTNNGSASPVHNTIAYVRPNNDTGDEIHLIAPDGSNDRRISVVGTADPEDVIDISHLDWRPDATELAFASNHEQACSWYESDIYTVQSDGNSLRRVTNPPTCSALNNYSKGTVRVTVENFNYDQSVYFVYVQGAAGLKMTSLAPGGSEELEFTNVADFGEAIQPVVAIGGLERWIGAAAADVQPGQTVDAGTLTISGSGLRELGAYKPTWRSDGSQVGYTMGCAAIYGIAADNPAAGGFGQPLVTVEGMFPCLMDWGPTSATADQILYFHEGLEDRGIYLVAEGSTNAGEKLVSPEDYDSVYDIEWLPDASGFLFTKTDNFRNAANVYRYDFANGAVTPLTQFTNEFALDLSVSPDGQAVVFERTTLADDYGLEFAIPDLWIMTRDGTGVQLLVEGGHAPAWSW